MIKLIENKKKDNFKYKKKKIDQKLTTKKIIQRIFDAFWPSREGIVLFWGSSMSTQHYGKKA